MKVSALRGLLREELGAALRNPGIPPSLRNPGIPPSPRGGTSREMSRERSQKSSAQNWLGDVAAVSPAAVSESSVRNPGWGRNGKDVQMKPEHGPSPAGVSRADLEGKDKKTAIAQSLGRQRLEMKQHREQERQKLRRKRGKAINTAINTEEKCLEAIHRMIPGDEDEYLSRQSGSFINAYLRPICESLVFRSTVTAVIIANSCFIYVFTDELFKWESGQITDWWIGYQILEDFFLVFYSLELFLKALVYRLLYFCGDDRTWNIFDFLLVITGLVTRTAEAASADPSFLRVIRLMKIVKIFRSLRFFRQLDSLRILLNCLLGTFWELIWSIIMITGVFFMFSTVLVQLVSRQLSLADDEGFQQISEYFGSERRAMLSLYKATTGGDDWSMYFDLLSSVSSPCGFVFLFVICFMQISLLNIVTGLFIEKAMDHAKPDSTGKALLRAHDNLKLLEALETLAESINMKNSDEDDANTTITAHKFCTAVNEEMELRNMLEVLGLDLSDTQAFFELLLETQGFSKDAAISTEDFVCGCLTLKGPASARDIIALTGRVKLVIAHQEITMERQETCVNMLGKMMRLDFGNSEVSVNGDWKV
jgi:hypothetical protein